MLVPSLKERSTTSFNRWMLEPTVPESVRIGTLSSKSVSYGAAELLCWLFAFGRRRETKNVLCIVRGTNPPSLVETLLFVRRILCHLIRCSIPSVSACRLTWSKASTELFLVLMMTIRRSLLGVLHNYAGARFQMLVPISTFPTFFW